jgi:hypothetical protein
LPAVPECADLAASRTEQRRVFDPKVVFVHQDRQGLLDHRRWDVA